MISQARARNALRVVAVDQVAGNGEVKSRRKTSKLSAKEVLITGTVVDFADAAVDEDTGEEDMVETANPNVDVVDIVLARRKVPRNYDMATTKGFPCAVQNQLFFPASGQKAYFLQALSIFFDFSQFLKHQE